MCYKTVSRVLVTSCNSREQCRSMHLFFPLSAVKNNEFRCTYVSENPPMHTCFKRRMHGEKIIGKLPRPRSAERVAYVWARGLDLAKFWILRGSRLSTIKVRPTRTMFICRMKILKNGIVTIPTKQFEIQKSEETSRSEIQMIIVWIWLVQILVVRRKTSRKLPSLGISLVLKNWKQSDVGIPEFHIRILSFQFPKIPSAKWRDPKPESWLRRRVTIFIGEWRKTMLGNAQRKKFKFRWQRRRSTPEGNRILIKSHTDRPPNLTTIQPLHSIKSNPKQTNKMAPLDTENKGDFKDQQFAENEVADKVVEQCEFLSVLFHRVKLISGFRMFEKIRQLCWQRLLGFVILCHGPGYETYPWLLSGYLPLTDDDFFVWFKFDFYSKFGSDPNFVDMHFFPIHRNRRWSAGPSLLQVRHGRRWIRHPLRNFPQADGYRLRGFQGHQRQTPNLHGLDPPRYQGLRGPWSWFWTRWNFSRGMCFFVENLERCFNFGHFCRRPIPNCQNDVMLIYFSFVLILFMVWWIL